MNPKITVKICFVAILTLLLSACERVSENQAQSSFHLPPEGFVGDSAKGAELYRQNCQSCHGVGGKGSNQGPPFLHKTYNPNHHADLAFHLAAKNGVRAHHWSFGDMKPLPNVSPETVGHIIAYVRDIQRAAGIK